MALSFYPVGHFPTRNCPTGGSDADCVGDKYEACLLETACGGVSCEAAEQQRLASFLNCFEYEHGSDMSFSASCAAAAGFDIKAISECVSSPVRSGRAFDAVAAAAKAGMANASCFPWIVIDGEVASTDPEGGCFGEDPLNAPLLQMLCKAMGKSGILPPGCNTD